MHDLSVTLVAIATPHGRGGVGCIRLSGPDAVRIAERLFRLQGTSEPATGSSPRFGRFVGRDEREVDHGYLVVFAPGHSFTGELTAELWPHGSPAVLAELIEAAVEAGAAPAGPGEFTYRAVRHGRIDLARAEAIRDLVAARTLYQARVAFAQAEGALSRRLGPLRERLADHFNQSLQQRRPVGDDVDSGVGAFVNGDFHEEPLAVGGHGVVVDLGTSHDTHLEELGR